jgi:hypothetical protein
MAKQLTLPRKVESDLATHHKATRRDVFLAEMEDRRCRNVDQARLSEPRKQQSPASLRGFVYNWCPREDSNLHGFTR